MLAYNHLDINVFNPQQNQMQRYCRGGNCVGLGYGWAMMFILVSSLLETLDYFFALITFILDQSDAAESITSALDSQRDQRGTAVTGTGRLRINLFG